MGVVEVGVGVGHRRSIWCREYRELGAETSEEMTICFGWKLVNVRAKG